VPLLVIRGRGDRMSTREWGQRLAALSSAGEYVEVPGAHTFMWRDPDAWSPPVRRFAERLP
jgi:pimeloyl-ACP methyl ester carboxylesterase